MKQMHSRSRMVAFDIAGAVEKRNRLRRRSTGTIELGSAIHRLRKDSIGMIELGSAIRMPIAVTDPR